MHAVYLEKKKSLSFKGKHHLGEFMAYCLIFVYLY